MLEFLLAFMCASFAPCLATLGDAALCLVLESCDKRCRWSAYYDEAWVIDKVATEYVEPCLVCVLVQSVEAAHIIERRSKTLAVPLSVQKVVDEHVGKAVSWAHFQLTQ